MIYLCLALVVIVGVQTLALIRLTRAVQAVSRFGERIAHLAAAMELLTDTTEAGLGNIAVAIDQSPQMRERPQTRRATSRRITTAARRGDGLDQIAAAEHLSESEVRLHLHMASPEQVQEAGRAAMRV